MRTRGSWVCLLCASCSFGPSEGAAETSSEVGTGTASGSESESEGEDSAGSEAESGDYETGWCLAEGTRVRTPSGSRAIEELSVGDAVLSVDPKTGRTFSTSVVSVASALRPCIELHLEGGGTLRLTREHPIYVAAHDSYAHAGHWLAGELERVSLWTHGGLTQRRVRHCVALEGDCRVYDIGVEHDLHNFLAEDVLVHNKVDVLDTSGTGDDGEPLNACDNPCDIWDPLDCGDGNLKCSVLRCDEEAATWDRVGCVEMNGDGQLDDACQRDDTVAGGTDSCDRGLYCWDPDPLSGFGRCVSFCQVTPNDPLCPEATRCQLLADGLAPLCLHECNPLTQDCENGAPCLPSTDGLGFVCIGEDFDSELDYGAACESSCAAGLLCVDGTLVPESGCDERQDCCTPFCDLSASSPCPGVGQSCVSLWEGSTAPPPWEQVGLCQLPAP